MRKKDYKMMHNAAKNKKLVFIDFDNVLIDTRAFGKEWLGAFISCGVSPEDAQSTYNQAKATRISYDFNQHVDILKEKYPSLNLVWLEKQLDAVRSLSHRFVFTDVVSFFEQIADRGIFELITSGAENHQPGKIHASGLASHFNHIHLVPPGVKKSDAIRRCLPFLGTESFIFIDDLKENIDDVKSAFPNSCAIQLLRFEDQERSDIADAHVKNLYDIISWLDEK